ncbi:hypothetical protein COOONC_01153 [Cooperia oncophora]
MGAPLHDCQNDHKECNTVITENMTDADLIKAMHLHEIRARQGSDICLSSRVRKINKVREQSRHRSLSAERKHCRTNRQPQYGREKADSPSKALGRTWKRKNVVQKKSSNNTFRMMPLKKSVERKQNYSLRIVFDASSNQRGRLSSNDVLYRSATFINKIHDILTYNLHLHTFEYKKIAAISAELYGCATRTNHHFIITLWSTDDSASRLALLPHA